MSNSRFDPVYIENNAIQMRLLEQAIEDVMPDILLMKGSLEVSRQVFLRGMLYRYRAYVLADHIEHQEVTYDTVTLPKWLRWLDRFMIKERKKISLEYFKTYPEAKIPMPQLGKGRDVITMYQDTISRHDPSKK